MSFLVIIKFDLEMTLNDLQNNLTLIWHWVTSAMTLNLGSDLELSIPMKSSLCNFEYVQVDAYVVMTVLTYINTYFPL